MSCIQKQRPCCILYIFMIPKQQGSQRRGTRTGDRAVHNGAILELYGYCLIVQFHQKPAHAIFQAFLSLLAFSTRRNTMQNRKKKLKPPDNQVSPKNKKKRNVPDELHGAWLPFSLACFCEKGTSMGTKASKIWAKCSSVVRPPKISSAFEPARCLSLFRLECLRAAGLLA